MKKFDVTRKVALANVLSAMDGVEFEDDTIAVLENMLDQLNAKSAKPKGKSATAVRNLELAKKVAVDMDGKTFKAKELTNLGYAEIGSVSKATAILKIGADNGIFNIIEPTTKSGSQSYEVL